jgi:hypothetical protein
LFNRESLKQAMENDPSLKRAMAADLAGIRRQFRSAHPALFGGMGPAPARPLKKINPTQPPSKPPITTVAFADDGNGRRFKITTLIEEI